MNAMDVALICKALGDANRLEIVKMLSDGEKCGCKLLERFEITQPTLSHHMKILMECGLVNACKDGKWQHYSLNCETLTQFKEFIEGLTCCGCGSNSEGGGLLLMGKFITDQILGMKWLNTLIGNLLGTLGLDVTSRIGGSIQFFLYDVIKITVLLCVLIYLISYIQSYFPPERSKKIMGRFHGIWANCIAALLGTVTPFCSCSSIPLFIGFTSAGLPLGVTFSFLISSPMVDLGSLVLLMSIFGAKVAILYVVLGLVLAVAGGTLIEKLHMENQVEEFIRRASAVDIASPTLTQKERLVYAKDQVAETFKKVFPYILIGVGIGAVIHNWIPESWVVAVLGSHNPFGVILATIIGIPMYADIFGTIPIAEALLGKGAQLGTVLAFMMGVTTLSLPSMIMLRKAVKPKLLGVFIAICALGIIVVGYLFNLFQGFIL